MSVPRKIIAGLNDLKVYPHAVTRLTVKGITGLNGDDIYGQGSS